MLRTLALLLIISAGIAHADDVIEPPVERLTKTYYDKFFLRYSPDGSHLIYSRHHRNLRQANQVLVGLRVVKADGTDDRPLLAEWDASVQIQEHGSFSPDGHQLVISGGGNDTGNSAKDTFVAEISTEFQAAHLRKVIAGTGVMLGEEPCWSPDGKRLCFVTIDEKLWVADADGANRTQLVQVDGLYCHQPAWSPDGKWIAFATDRDGNVEIYKVRWDGSELTRLTDDPGFDCRPRWSRDGRWLLFTSNRGSNHDLYVMRDNGIDVRRLTFNAALDDHGDWSPDATTIAFVSMRDGGFDIYRMPVPADLKIGPPATIDYEQPASRELLAHYDFDSVLPTATSIIDRAGANPLQLLGATVVSSGARGSLHFDGSDDSALVGNPLALRTSGPLTISVWVRADGFAGNGYVLSKQGWNIYVGPDGLARFETRSANDTAWLTLPAGRPLKTAEWNFVAAVFDPEQQRESLYLDGALSAERPRTDGAIGATAGYPLQLGRYGTTNSQGFRGELDEIRIYGRALSADELRQQFHEQRPRIVGP
ncbi:MAG: PD40 domain-containing protein [Planctomycetaceae bacterium]|nr:PD40 domain-containing protein [Planctomycetaceae bacterium]